MNAANVSKKPLAPPPPTPTSRLLRAFAYDPKLATELENFDVSEVTIPVQWEKLEPGPVGEYLEVIDWDPASDCAYPPVNLDDPRLAFQDGLAPSEGNPQFHQQMVYAVAMTTIQHFEKALGRRALWSPRKKKRKKAGAPDEYVPRLRIYPHAMREANAYYSPE